MELRNKCLLAHQPRPRGWIAREDAGLELDVVRAGHRAKWN